MTDQILHNAYAETCDALNKLERALHTYNSIIPKLTDRKLGELRVGEKVSIASAILKIQKVTNESPM